MMPAKSTKRHYDKLETVFAATAEVDKLTTHYLENTLPCRNPDFTVKEGPLQLYKTVGREHSHGGKARILATTRIPTNDEECTRGHRTVFTPRGDRTRRF